MDYRSPNESSKDEKDHKVEGGPIITLIGTIITGSMGLAATVLLANSRNYLKPHKGKAGAYQGRSQRGARGPRRLGLLPKPRGGFAARM